jgi:glycosyltransferase involved in cell wall biosynthesis
LTKVAEEVAALNVYLFADRAGVSTRSGTLPVAFGAGVPVVAVPGPETDDQLFADGKNLIYADEFTDRGLAAAILRLLDDQPLADRVSEGGRELYDRHLSWPAIADRLLSAD